MISVVVCTYNRSKLLATCLDSLAEQSLGKEFYEVIVVDNYSTDDTIKVAGEFAHREPDFKLCREERRGANHARNTGVTFAHGDYLAFIDDDAVAHPDWLLNIHDHIRRNPDVVVFGGPYDAYSITPPPDWFPPEYGSLNYGEVVRPVKIGAEWITGTNLIVRKDAFLSVGGFHDKLGTVKDGVFYFGEETRLLVDLTKRGHTVYYVPSVKVKHLIRSDKMFLGYLLVSSYRMGRNHGITLNEQCSLISHVVSVIATMVNALIKLVSFSRVPMRRTLYYAFNPLFYVSGALVENIVAHTRSNKDS